MKSFDCLNPQQPLEELIFLEASAGTGKTFAIEHIVCRLLLKGISLKRILITTFTKKGVRDLRKRIFSNLQKALTSLKTGQDLTPYLEGIEDRKEAILTLETNLALIQEAEIHTIHSFCFRSLNDFAFDAGFSLDQEDPESQEKKRQTEIAILDTLRMVLDDSEFSPSQLMRLMNHFQRDTKKLIKKIALFLDSDPIIEPYESYGSLKRNYDELLSALDIERLKDDLYALSTIHKKCCDRKGNRFAFIDEQIEAIDHFESLISKTPSIFEIFTDKHLKSGKSRNDLTLMYSDIIDHLGKIVLEASDPLITFMRLSALAQTKVDQVFLKNPNVLLDSMVNCLTIPSFFEKVQNQFDSVIIDEFQDTDPKQWQIFSSLFLKTANPFVVVGDPKQSIYSFRGANIDTYLEAKKYFTHHYVLKTNFRSDPTLVSSLNRLFDETHVAGLFSFEEASLNLKHLPVDAGKDNLDGSSISAFISSEGEDQLMQFIGYEICRLYAEEKRAFSKVAILVKDRYQAEKMGAVLQKFSIPCISTQTESIVSSKAFEFLEIVFKIAQSPRNLSYINQFLLHPFVGWPYQCITTDLTSNALTHVLVKLMALIQTITSHDHAYFLRAIMNEEFSYGLILENVLQNPHDYNDLMHLIELIFSTNRNDPLEAIDQLKNELDSDDPYLKRRALTDQDAVTIMTMHMSKGLEFDIVFPIGLIAETKAKQEFTKTDHQKVCRFSHSDPRSLKQLAKLDQEKMRLFYVAVTRAKEKLYLPFLLSTSKSAPKFGTASPADLYLSRLVTQQHLSLPETYEKIAHLTLEEVTQTLHEHSIESVIVDQLSLDYQLEVKSEETHLPPPCEIILSEKVEITASFSSLASPKTTFSSLIIGENEIPPGAATGTLFHSLYEKIIEMSLYYPWNEEKIRQLIEKTARHTHLLPFLNEIYQLIETSFHTNLFDFSLLDVRPEMMLQESVFFYSLNDYFHLKGFVDLVFSHRGKYYLLDWKLNYLNQDSLQNLEQVMREHDYFKQAAIYLETLKRYIKVIHPDQPFKQLFGGMIYFFVRGGEKGIYPIPDDLIDRPLNTTNLITNGEKCDLMVTNGRSDDT